MTDEMRDPRRLLDDPETSEVLRAALEAARDDLPTEGELASLASRLGPLLGGPGAGGGGGDGGASVDPSALAAGGTGAAAKAIGVIVASAAIGGAIWWGTATTERAPRPRPEPRAEIVEAPREPPTAEIPEGIDVPSEAIEEPDPDVRPRPIEAPALEHDPEAEAALLRSAQDALRTSPSSALDLTREHERRFGEGTLGQEREVVAIDALVRLGRADDARARADRFRERWPRSAHRRRIDVLLAP